MNFRDMMKTTTGMTDAQYRRFQHNPDAYAKSQKSVPKIVSRPSQRLEHQPVEGPKADRAQRAKESATTIGVIQEYDIGFIKSETVSMDDLLKADQVLAQTTEAYDKVKSRRNDNPEKIVAGERQEIAEELAQSLQAVFNTQRDEFNEAKIKSR